jgi:hypothetical protein
MSVVMNDFEYENDPDAPAHLPMTAADWIVRSLALEPERRCPAPCEAAALLHLRDLCRRINLPLACGRWRPGDIIWWPETESGFVAAFGNAQQDVLLLIDQQTAYWRLRRAVWNGGGQECQRAHGVTLSTLVGLRLDCGAGEAAQRLAGWYRLPRDRRVA